jgi:hypothetical protein
LTHGSAERAPAGCACLSDQELPEPWASQMDGSAIIEYFQPLMVWLEEQNKGRQCGTVVGDARSRLIRV